MNICQGVGRTNDPCPCLPYLALDVPDINIVEQPILSANTIIGTPFYHSSLDPFELNAHFILECTAAPGPFVKWSTSSIIKSGENNNCVYQLFVTTFYTMVVSFLRSCGLKYNNTIQLWGHPIRLHFMKTISSN